MDLETDITVFVGANSAKLTYLLLDISCELRQAIYSTSVITVDEDDLRVDKILINKNKHQAAIFHCPDAFIHPYLFPKLYEILKTVSLNKQVIVATYNPIFLNYFEPRMVRVVERNKGVLSINSIEQTAHFLAAMEAFDGSLGELWYTNHFGGNPFRSK